MIQALSTLLPCCYLALVGLCAAAFVTSEERRYLLTRRGLLILTLGLHVGLIAARSAAVPGMPSMGGFTALSPLAFAIASLHAWFARVERGQAGSATITYAVACLLQLVSSAFAPLEVLPAHDRPALFYALHVSSVLVASAALAISGIDGVLYLTLYRQMRLRRFGPLFESLPSLDQLASRMRRAALFACLFLAIGVNAGIWWAHRAKVTGFSYQDPFVLGLIALMLHFGLVACSRRIPFLTARRASMAAVGGLILLVVSLGYSLLPQGFHWVN
jgi:ABC-type uncharacterized transport system permease subunit